MSSADIEAVLLEMAWAYANNSPTTCDKVPWGEVRKGMRAALAAALTELKRPITRAADPMEHIRNYLSDCLAELDAPAAEEG